MNKNLRIELAKAYTELVVTRDALSFWIDLAESSREIENLGDPEDVLEALLTMLESFAEQFKHLATRHDLEAVDWKQLLRCFVKEEDEDRLSRRLAGIRTEMRDVAPPLRIAT